MVLASLVTKRLKMVDAGQKSLKLYLILVKCKEMVVKVITILKRG